MSGLKEYPELDKLKLTSKDKHRRQSEANNSSTDRIAELLSEIYERIEWLKEMNELGEGKKHRQVIDAEVTERLREIKKLEEKLAHEKRDGLQSCQRDNGHNHNNWRNSLSAQFSLSNVLFWLEPMDYSLFRAIVSINFSPRVNRQENIFWPFSFCYGRAEPRSVSAKKRGRKVVHGRKSCTKLEFLVVCLSAWTRLRMNFAIFFLLPLP